jgi:hypothetical protein
MRSRDLLLDEPASLGWQQYGIAFDGEVGTTPVAVETIDGQFNEADDGKGVSLTFCPQTLRVTKTATYALVCYPFTHLTTRNTGNRP